MSNKPQIFAKCKSGCNWETIHRSEFEQIVPFQLTSPSSDGMYYLQAEKEYRVYLNHEVTNRAYTTTMNLRVIKSASGVLQEIEIPYDRFKEYVVVKLVGYVNNAIDGDYTKTAATIYYEIDGVRSSFTTSTANGDNITNLYLLVSNSDKVLEVRSELGAVSLECEKLFIRYADDEYGTNMTDEYTGQHYMGTYVGVEASGNVSDYTWMRTKGAEGDSVVDDGSVTPQKTSFINHNIVYENELLTFDYNGTWRSKDIRVDNVRTSTEYTILVESVEGTVSGSIPVIIQEYDSSGTRLKEWYAPKIYSNISYSITTQDTTSYIILCFYASNGTTGSGTAIFRGIQFIEGTEVNIQLDPKINIKPITQEDTTFIESNIIFKKESETVTWNKIDRYWLTNLLVSNINNIENNYTLIIDKVINYNPNMTTVVIFRAVDSENKDILARGAIPDINGSIKIELENIPVNTAKLQISLYAYFNGIGSDYITYEGIRIYKGQNKEYQLNNNISLFDNDIAKKYNIPILYLNGSTRGMDKDNKVTLDYVYGNRKGTCTTKWQGTSSLQYPKKNYTIVFDNAFEVVEGWGSQNKYCLKANYIDFSHARNVVSAKLWGQIVKSRTNVPTQLSTLVNGGAIDGFPCVVVINGEYQGLYSFNIPKEDWLFGMGSGTNECIVSAEQHSDMTKFKVPITIDGEYFDYEYITDEDNATWAETSLNNIYNALQNVNADNIDTTLGQYLDIESAIDYYIFAQLIYGFDITGKNCLYVTYDGVKWIMSAYDLDSTWGNYWDGKSILTAKGTELWDTYEIMKALVNYKKEEIKERYTYIKQNIMSEENIMLAFYNYSANIPLALLNKEVEVWTDLPNTLGNNVNQIINWYRLRLQVVDNFINNL